MKPYASYKPSGVAWLGDVPSHWASKRLKHIGQFRAGAGFPIEEQGQPDNPLPFFKVKDIDGSNQGGVITTADSTVSIETANRLGAKIFPKNSIVFAKVGAALLLNRFRLLGVDACVDNNMMGYMINADEAFPEFMYWAMQRINFSEIVNPGTVPSLNEPLISNLFMAIPPPDEQQAIADYLDAETARIDTLVQEKDELIGLLREARSNRISELISGDGLPGSATGNPWVPHLPEGWQLKRLKHLAQVRSGLAKGKDTGSNTTVELPYLRVANVQEGRLDLREISTMPVEVDAVERFSLMEGDVLMNEGGDYDKVGRGAVWTGEISPCLHQNHVFAVRPVQRDLSEWISAITQTQYAKFYFMNNAKQSTNLASISQASVKELPILLPPKEQRDALLEKLGGELAAFDALIAHTQEEIALLKELRAATIADAVLGRVDVRSLNRKQ